MSFQNRNALEADAQEFDMFCFIFPAFDELLCNFQAVKKHTEECRNFQISVSYRNQIICSHFPYSLL